MRAGLHDDPGFCRCDPQATAYSIPVGLDDDWPGGCGSGRPGGDTGNGGSPADPVPTDALPTLTVRERTRTYYEADGAPRYEWTDLVSGPALTLSLRTEVNDATGQTRVTASATIGYTGKREPSETAVVIDSRGWRWDVTACRVLPDRMELQLERISDAD